MSRFTLRFIDTSNPRPEDCAAEYFSDPADPAEDSEDSETEDRDTDEDPEDSDDTAQECRDYFGLDF